MEGLFVMGQNPAVGAPNARARAASAREAEVARRPRHGRDRDRRRSGTTRPKCSRGELAPEQIGTEVFFFPAAGHAEKDGQRSRTRSGCCSGTRRPSSRPATAAASVVRLSPRPTAQGEGGRAMPRPRNDGLRALTWDYPTDGPHDEPDGRGRAAGDQRPPRRRSGDSSRASRDLAADGSTACGCWIYSGVYPRAGRNRANERDAARRSTATAGASRGRRIAASSTTARRRGPTAGRGASARSSSGGTRRSRSGPASTCPISRDGQRRPTTGRRPAPSRRRRVVAATQPFIMHADGLGWLWVPTGLRTARCRRTTSRSSRRSRTSVYEQQINPAADRTRARPTTRGRARPTTRASRTC